MGDRHYSYDAAGNLIKESRGKADSVTEYTYNQDNRKIGAGNTIRIGIMIRTVAGLFI
jgi:YD repeat-containing protein